MMIPVWRINSFKKESKGDVKFNINSKKGIVSRLIKNFTILSVRIIGKIETTPIKKYFFTFALR